MKQEQPRKRQLPKQEFLEHGKLPPQDVELERAILGSILMEKSAYSIVSKILTADSFYREDSQLIYKIFNVLNDSSEPIDMLTVVSKAHSQGVLESIGGAYGISQLSNRIASTVNLEHHCFLLKQHQLKREQILFGSEIINEAYDPTIDCLTTNEKISLKANDLLGVLNNTKDLSALELIKETTNTIQKAEKTKGITGIKSGFSLVDQITRGWQDTDLIIIAARPSMGKTAYILSMVRNMVVDFDYNVAFFSLEMSGQQLMTRLISNQTKIPIFKLQTGKLDANDWVLYNKNIEPLITDKINIFDDVNYKNIHLIKSKCLELKAKGKLDIIFVDYMQLLEHPSFRNNREREVSEISKMLKQIARALNVPLIALSQLSRKVEDRPNKKPMLSDLRDSGSIEQDADIVQFLFRPSYYEMKDKGGNDMAKNLALAMIKKHRNGDLKTSELNFDGSTVTFSDWKGKIEDLPF
jgi:replicative DNA helicase